MPCSHQKIFSQPEGPVLLEWVQVPHHVRVASAPASHCGREPGQVCRWLFPGVPGYLYDSASPTLWHSTCVRQCGLQRVSSQEGVWPCLIQSWAMPQAVFGVGLSVHGRALAGQSAQWEHLLIVSASSGVMLLGDSAAQWDFFTPHPSRYIGHKEHLHMNATKWLTLTEFIKHLGREGLCVVDETEKGWYITYIDRDPEVSSGFLVGPVLLQAHMSVVRPATSGRMRCAHGGRGTHRPCLRPVSNTIR